MTAQAGASNIELFPGQTLSKDNDSVKVGPDMGAENTEKLRGFLAKNNVKAIAFGVTGISTKPEDARKLFAWAKSLGIQVIVLPGRAIAPDSLFEPRITVSRNYPSGHYRLPQEVECVSQKEAVS